MDLLEDLKMALLNLSFAMIYVIHKMLVLLKNDLNYLNDFEFSHPFLRSIIDFLFLKIFSTTYNDGKFRS